MVQQANPLNALNQMYGTLQAFDQDRTRTRAGRAYAGGDARGASSALAEGGLVQEAADLDYRGAQQERIASEQEIEAASQRATVLMRGVQALQQVPYEQRQQVWQQLAPSLSGLMPPEIIQQLEQADKSDQNLAAFGAALGQEAERLQLFQTRAGDIIGVNPTTGDNRVVYDGPEQAPDAPNGYRWTADGSLEAIPGGPADPRVTSSLAASRRAPPRGRSGGSSGGGSRPAAPSRPATPAGGGSLPPGFTVRRR